MQIICTTIDIAAQVLAILMDAGLQPRFDFEIRPVIILTPPIIFTALRVLPSPLLSQIRALSDIELTG